MPMTFVCDGTPDCRAGEDETDCAQALDGVCG